MSELFILIGLFVLNGLFSMCEIALISARQSRLQRLSQDGSKGARIAITLQENPENFLSAVQLGITVASVFAGAYGAQAYASYLEPFFEQFALTREIAWNISFIVIEVVIVFSSIIVGELTPKTIALNYPETIAVFFSPFMRALVFVSFPIVWFLRTSTRILLKILMVPVNKKPPVTEEDLRYMIESGSRHGIIEKQESDILSGVMHFADRHAKDLITPRSEIVWINSKDSAEEILKTVLDSPFTDYPLCDGSLDELLGVVSVKEILRFNQEKETSLVKYISPPVFFPGQAPSLQVLDYFRKHRLHIAFVVDEYGSITGLLTLHDLVEKIVGRLPAKNAGTDEEVIYRDDGSMLVDGKISTEQLKELLLVEELPNEASYSTLAGFTIYQLRRIPQEGDSFEFENFKFEVVDMDDKRIDKLLVKPLPAADPHAP